MTSHVLKLLPLLALACTSAPAETTDATTDAPPATGTTGTTGPGPSTGPDDPTPGEPTSTGSTAAADPTTDVSTGTDPTTTTDPDPTTGTGTDPETDATTDAVDPPASLDDVVDGELEQLADGHMFTEGPAWSPEGFVVYSDIPANKIFRWQEGMGSSVFIDPSDNSNGLAFDPMGRLLAAEHGARRVSRRVIGEAAVAVADEFEGKPLNSPNDLVQRSDGTIYFTDPPYGIDPQEQEQPFQGVFRVDPQGQISLVADDFDRPNGIVLSPDETRLYVADTQTELVRVFDVQPDGDALGGETFIDLQSDLQGNPDGMTVDEFGDIYVTGGGGVRVVTPAAELLGTIEVPESVTNCTFGDPDGRSLFLTAGPKLYRIRLKVKGL